MLHVTAQSVSKWESGASFPDINQLPAIASFFGITNRLAFNGEYQDAIATYEKAHVCAPKPRYTDMLACVAWLNRCVGNKPAAVEAYKRELALLKDEWNVTKGELVDTLKNNIALLEKEMLS